VDALDHILLPLREQLYGVQDPRLISGISRIQNEWITSCPFRRVRIETSSTQAFAGSILRSSRETERQPSLRKAVACIDKKASGSSTKSRGGQTKLK